MKISELLNSPERWTQNQYALDRYGNPVKSRSPHACQWCLVGALIRCYFPEPGFREAEEKLYETIRRREQRFGGRLATLASWNDHPDRTFEEVRELVVEAGV